MIILLRDELIAMNPATRACDRTNVKVGRQGNASLAKYSLGSGFIQTFSVAPQGALNPTLAVTRDFNSEKQYFLFWRRQVKTAQQKPSEV
ncbi:hypothetical protein EJA72_23110 [Pseudomonas sp. PB120]|uniref:hypothetical protein n=1 Tax=Pseudomonas sp. PB120 TaxID=2494700 RepID=UPI0012FDD0FA|nr:hypothetical protein [Pseudomonas sp. PB120]MVV51107.1 hypothetical protein [Pseudomonas sp. PB120]